LYYHLNLNIFIIYYSMSKNIQFLNPKKTTSNLLKNNILSQGHCFLCFFSIVSSRNNLIWNICINLQSQKAIKHCAFGYASEINKLVRCFARQRQQTSELAANPINETPPKSKNPATKTQAEHKMYKETFKMCFQN